MATTIYMVRDLEGRNIWGAFRSLEAAQRHLEDMVSEILAEDRASGALDEMEGAYDPLAHAAMIRDQYEIHAIALA